ncbi:ATP-binding protein [Massilia varians]
MEKNFKPASIEDRRLSALYGYNILDTAPEQHFDDIISIAAHVLDAPIAAINLIDRDRQWFKSEVGLGVREMPLDDSICKQVLLEAENLVIPDLAKDARFSCNRLVSVEAGLRFYAGALLKNTEGLALGTLCVLDTKPRPEGLSEQQRFTLEALARQVMTLLELRKSVQAQKESEAKFRTIANAMPQMVWSTLPDGYHDYYNDRWYEFTGVPYGSTDGEGWNDMFHPDDREHAWEVWRHSLATGEQYEIEYRLKNHSSGYRWTLGRALPIRDDKGKIVRWMGTCTDIHEQKVAQEALRESDRRKDEFLAMLAHELRNPLAPISAAAHVLSIDGVARERIVQVGEIISRQTRHMTALIDDLLDVSRVTRGLVKINNVAVDMKLVMEQAIEQVRPLALARNHHLDSVLPLEEALVTGDESRLVQILSNLLTNAVRYTPQAGRISVQLDIEPENVLLIVRDNGIGMNQDLLQIVFDPFTQGQRSSDRSQGGLGLGLALVKSLVELHGGTVSAFSDGPGQGSEFKIVLPRLLDEEDTLQSEAILDAIDFSETALRVLIVDDNADAAQMLGMLVEAGGCQAYIENHPLKALERAKIIRPNICLLDIGLPELDGMGLARQLRLAPETRDAKLIAVTGYGQEDDRLASQAAGFDEHLVKPVELKQLVSIFRENGLSPSVNV